MSAELLAEQQHYYTARAPEYDDWFFRRGRYERGDEHAARWHGEATEVRWALERFQPSGHILELAPGTGLWTQQLLRYGASVSVVEGSAAMARELRRRIGGAPVTMTIADIFSWEPRRRYDTIFFAFWLSHVPAARFEGFWAAVRDALAPGGRVYLVDSLYEPRSTAKDHSLPGSEGEQVVRRRLDDGREFDVVKVFWTPETLSERLAGLGLLSELRSTERFFIHGAITRQTGA